MWLLGMLRPAVRVHGDCSTYPVVTASICTIACHRREAKGLGWSCTSVRIVEFPLPKWTLLHQSAAVSAVRKLPTALVLRNAACKPNPFFGTVPSLDGGPEESSCDFLQVRNPNHTEGMVRETQSDRCDSRLQKPFQYEHLQPGPDMCLHEILFGGSFTFYKSLNKSSLVDDLVRRVGAQGLQSVGPVGIPEPGVEFQRQRSSCESLAETDDETVPPGRHEIHDTEIVVRRHIRDSESIAHTPLEETVDSLQTFGDVIEQACVVSESSCNSLFYEMYSRTLSGDSLRDRAPALFARLSVPLCVTGSEAAELGAGTMVPGLVDETLSEDPLAVFYEEQ